MSVGVLVQPPAEKSVTTAMSLVGALRGGAIGTSVTNKREGMFVGAALGVLFAALVDVALASGSGTLVDAELFGVVKGYPNAGSPELLGLLGQVDGGTLFLDEIGELPATLQVHLLRVLDAGGDYQRLGEGRTRRANFRLIAATNRPASALKGDFGARFKIRVEVVGLDRRREDIPLLFRHLLAAARRDNPRAVERFFERHEGGPGVARIDPQVIEALLRHRFTLHTRELERLMWTSLATSPGDFLTVTPELRAELGLGGAAERALRAKRKTDPGEIGREELVAALAAAGGSVAQAAAKLGVSRFAVYRLMKRHGVSG